MEQEKYYIGREIKKEMEAQGFKPIELAERIHRTKSALYSIFKKSHIATDLLAEIQRILGRDFFLELSQHTQNGTLATLAEDEGVLRERFEMLMPEDKLHVINHEAFYVLAEEFVNTEHHKPLVIFHNHWKSDVPDIIQKIADNDLKSGPVHNVSLSQLHKKGRSDDEIINDAKSMPQPILKVACRNCDEDFLFLKKLAEGTGKNVYAYIPAENKPVQGFEYEDVAIESFRAWYEQFHFVFVDNESQSYRRNRQLFLALHLENVLDFLKSMCSILPSEKSSEQRKKLMEWLTDPKHLMEAYRKHLDSMAVEKDLMKDCRLMYFDDDEISITRDRDTRWTISLPVCVEYQNYLHDGWVKDQLAKRYFRPSMWIEINKDGIDYQG